MTNPSDEQPMTDAELRITREWLGLTGDALAGILHIDPRRIRRWEAGERIIPPGIAADIRALEDEAAAEVADLHAPDGGLRIPRTTTDGERPASWHRAIAARVRDRNPGTRLHYEP